MEDADFDGSDFDHSALLPVCQRNDVSFLGVFGSVARGAAARDSDVDLLVRFSTRKSMLDQARIEREFSEALGRPADLLTEAAISPYLKERIQSETVVLYDEQEG